MHTKNKNIWNTLFINSVTYALILLVLVLVLELALLSVLMLVVMLVLILVLMVVLVLVLHIAFTFLFWLNQSFWTCYHVKWLIARSPNLNLVLISFCSVFTSQLLLTDLLWFAIFRSLICENVGMFNLLPLVIFRHHY